MSDIFRHLLVLGRPACGKSEFIDFLKHASDDVRRRRLHIGRFDEVDDFPWLWEKFLDDAIWEKAGYERLYTHEYMPGNPGMAPKGAKLFDWCMHKFNEVIGEQYLGRADFYNDSTLLIEFSRGGRDGFRRALGMLDPGILDGAAILYIHVSREESWRRNVARYQEKLRHSILAHMVPRETYDFFYDVNDWQEMTGDTPAGWLDVHGLRVPFVTMNNEPESTDPVVLEERYGGAGAPVGLAERQVTSPAGTGVPLTFDHLFVLGRPAGGKSEFIDFMKKLPADERARIFGIGRFEEIDDFPWLWDACLADDEREERGGTRLVSERTAEGYNITKPGFRGSLVDRFNEAISTTYLANPSFYGNGTLLIEFARGSDDGFRASLERFRPDILERAAILYISVSFDESFRRNNARYRKGQEESILFHKVPDRDMYGFFRDNDWARITDGASDGWIDVGGIRVPFVSMNNEPESTDSAVLRARYAAALGRLRELVRTR